MPIPSIEWIISPFQLNSDAVALQWISTDLTNSQQSMSPTRTMMGALRKTWHSASPNLICADVIPTGDRIGVWFRVFLICDGQHGIVRLLFWIVRLMLQSLVNLVFNDLRAFSMMKHGLATMSLVNWCSTPWVQAANRNSDIPRMSVWFGYEESTILPWYLLALLAPGPRCRQALNLEWITAHEL